VVPNSRNPRRGFITHDGSMVLLHMVTWIPSIYPLYVSIYTSTMDPMGNISQSAALPHNFVASHPLNPGWKHHPSSMIFQWKNMPSSEFPGPCWHLRKKKKKTYHSINVPLIFQLSNAISMEKIMFPMKNPYFFMVFYGQPALFYLSDNPIDVSDQKWDGCWYFKVMNISRYWYW